MHGYFKIVVVGLVFSFVFTLWAFSINFQGKVTDHSGKAYNGTLVSVCMVLKQLPGDLVIDTACVYDVSVDRGLFSVNLDVDSLPRDAITGDKRLVGVVVISDSTGEPQRLDPPIEITFVPLAYGSRIAAVAETAYALSSDAVEARFISADSARIGSSCSPKNPILDVYGSTQTPHPPDLTFPPDSIINVPVVRITAKLCNEAVDVGETRVDSFATTALQIILDTLDLEDSVIANDGNAIEVLKTIKKEVGWQKCTTFVVSGTDTLGVYIHRCETYESSSGSSVGLRVIGYDTAAYFESNVHVEGTVESDTLKTGDIWGQTPLVFKHWKQVSFLPSLIHGYHDTVYYSDDSLTPTAQGVLKVVLDSLDSFFPHFWEGETLTCFFVKNYVTNDTLLRIVVPNKEKIENTGLVVRFWGTVQVDWRVMLRNARSGDELDSTSGDLDTLRRALTRGSLIPGGYLAILGEIVREGTADTVVSSPYRVVMPLIQEGLPSQHFSVEMSVPIDASVRKASFTLVAIPFDTTSFRRAQVSVFSLLDVTGEVEQIKY